MLIFLPCAKPQDSASIFQVVRTPNPQGYSGNDLYAAAASGPNDIWAVGLTAIHYDGTTWTGYSLPGIDGVIGHQMKAVADLSPTNAWAVGSYAASGTCNGDILHWDGIAWSPSQSRRGRLLPFSIAAISAADIWAGGCIPAAFEHFD